MVCLQLNWNWITEAHRCLPNGAARQQTLKAVFQIIANYAFLVWKSRGGLKLWLYSGRNAKRLLSVEFANEHWWQFRMKLCSSFWVSDLLIPFSNMKPLSILKKSFFPDLFIIIGQFTFISPLCVWLYVELFLYDEQFDVVSVLYL